MEQLQDILRLYRKGVSQRRIGELVKLSRNTVRKYVRVFVEAGLAEGDPRDLPDLKDLQALVKEVLPQRRGRQEVSKLGRFEAQVEALRLKGASPKAVYDKLMRDEPEFDASLSSVKRFFARRRKPREEDVVIPVVHLPGDAMQVDFGYVGKLVDTEGVERKAYVFVAVLAYSKMMFVDIVFDQTTETWLQLHKRAFRVFQGVPKRVVPDNLKAAIIRHAYDVDGAHEVNRAYRELAMHYDFIIDPTPPYSPEKKGIVENGVRYVKGNFFSTHTSSGVVHDRQALKKWARETANRRTHGTTGQRPVDMMRHEITTLNPLPKTDFEICRWETRRVTKSAHVTIDGVRYSVPWKLLGEDVQVKVTQFGVSVYHELECVTDHVKPTDGARIVTKEAHLPAIRARRRQRNLEFWQDLASETGPDVEAYVKAILASDPVCSQLNRVIRCLELLDPLTVERKNAVCARALYFGNLEYKALKNIIEKGLEDDPILVEQNRPSDLEAFRFASTKAEILAAAALKGVTHGYN